MAKDWSYNEDCVFLFLKDCFSKSGVGHYKLLDGVGPVDNRPSTDELHHFVKKEKEEKKGGGVEQ